MPQKKQNKGNKTSIKKGEVRNPGGRPKLSPELNSIRNGSKPQIIEIYGKLSFMPVDKANVYSPKNLIEKGILKCLTEFADKGYTSEISKIWDQVHGKPTDSLGDNGKPIPTEIHVRFLND